MAANLIPNALNHRALWIDKLRVLSCFAVVLIHVSGEAYGRFALGQIGEWWLANFLNGSSRASVPLFVMLSGALMKECDCNPIYFYRKKAGRFLPVFGAWTIIYAVFVWVVMGLSVSEILLRFLSSGFVYLHLWYLSMFFFMLAFAPYLARLKYYYRGGESDRWILLSTCIAVISFDWLLGFISKFFDVPFNFWPITFVGFIPYFLLGLILVDLKSVCCGFKNGSYLAVALIFSWTANFLSCRYLGIVSDAMPLSCESPFVMAVAITVFLLVRQRGGMCVPNVWLRHLADASFGIYLLHPIFIWFFARILRGNDLDILSGWWMVVTATLVYVVSFVFMFFLRQFALGRRIS